MNARIEVHPDEPTKGQLVPAGQNALAGQTGYQDSGQYPNFDAPQPANLAFELREYFNVLRRHLLAIGIVTGVFLLLGMFLSLTAIPKYTSSLTLQIDRTVSKVVEGGNVSPLESGDAEFLKTQYEILQSRSVAERAVSLLKLNENKQFSDGIGFFEKILGYFGTNSTSETEQAARERKSVELVLENRSVKPVFGSRLVDLSFTDKDPVLAQKIANTLAESFIAANLDKRFEANSYAKTFLDDQLKQLKLRLQDSERVLIDFGEKEQIIATTEKASIAENNLSAANVALGKLIAERIKDEQLFLQADKSDVTEIQQVLQNKVIEELRTTRNKFLTEYQEKLQLFKPSYPEMIQIENKIKEIDRRIVAEARKIRSALRASYESSVSQEKEMGIQIEKLKIEVLDLQKRSVRYNILKREVETNRSLYESLLQRYKEVDIAGGVGANNIFVVDRAQLPRRPSSPKIWLNMGIALVLGLLIGILSAFAIEWMDDTISSEEDIQKLGGLITLGIIPKIENDRQLDDELSSLHSPLSEAYRTLCTSLSFATESGLPKSLFITSGGPSEGKSTTSIAIARHFAATGLKVLLVDGDLRKASLHTKLGLGNTLGLSNYLIGSCSPPAAFQDTGVANLTFLSSGPLPPNAADLLSSSRLSSLISVGSTVFDLIVIDGAPVMGLADAVLVSSVTAASVFVVASGRARKPAMKDALRRLRFGRSNLIGGILTMHDLKKSGSGYGYGYGYGYGQEEREGAALMEASANRSIADNRKSA